MLFRSACAGCQQQNLRLRSFPTALNGTRSLSKLRKQQLIGLRPSRTAPPLPLPARRSRRHITRRSPPPARRRRPGAPGPYQSQSRAASSRTLKRLSSAPGSRDRLQGHRQSSLSPRLSSTATRSSPSKRSSLGASTETPGATRARRKRTPRRSSAAYSSISRRPSSSRRSGCGLRES